MPLPCLVYQHADSQVVSHIRVAGLQLHGAAKVSECLWVLATFEELQPRSCLSE